MTATDAIQIFSTLSSEQREAIATLLLQGNSAAPARNRTSAVKRGPKPAERETTVATQTKSRKAAAAKAKAKGKQTTAKSTRTAKDNAQTNGDGDGPSKRELAKQRDAELTAQIVERRANDEKWSEIASDLNITSGKAQFLHMLHDVAEGSVPAIKYRNDEELASKIVAAREKQDEYSSWGWISARTGIAEGRVKALAEEAGHDVKGSNVAVARKAAKASTQTNGHTKTGGGQRKASTGATSAKAKAKAAKASKRRPTSRG